MSKDLDLTDLSYWKQDVRQPGDAENLGLSSQGLQRAMKPMVEQEWKGREMAWGVGCHYAREGL